MPAPKYITVNGVMKKNPQYVAEGATPSTPQVAQNSASLAIVSSLDDVMNASEIQSQKTGLVVPMAESASDTVEMLQDEEMLKLYKSRVPVDGGEILEKIGEKFAKYEMPFGMLNKLMMLTQYKLDFLVDDSGSMGSPTDVNALDATDHVKTVIRERLKREPRPGEKMTRLQEAEDRLHIMVGILAYIPIEHIQVRFLNDRKSLILDRNGKTPDEFEVYAHKEVRARFAALQLGSTPVQTPLQTGFDLPGKWCHYLLNDGVPDEGGDAIAKQIAKRKNPENHPLTLLSCTNEDEETEWMKKVDGVAKFVAELDDFQDEKDEVMAKQGEAFPFSRGMWLLCQLVAAINPFDLDALDENLPLTKSTLDNILGRQLNPNEYQYYFERNPNAVLYVKEYSRFLNEEIFSRQIISTTEQERREKAAGYIDGERPKAPLANISAQLAAATADANKLFAAKFSSQNADVATVTGQMSAASIAPRAAFMPAPAAVQDASFAYPPSYNQPTYG